MDFITCFEASSFLLAEASVLERLTRDKTISLHEHLANGMLIYTSHGRKALAALYGNYLDIALKAGLPILLQTPTWRAGHDRVLASGFRRPVNRHNVEFMHSLKRGLVTEPHPVFIGGLIGSRHDCYRPELAPDEDTARRYHAWQADELACAGVDFLIAATMPSVVEAKGAACALKDTGQPYLISFVIDRHGDVLDGTNLAEAIRSVDRATGSEPPVGYMINCAYPSFLDMASLTGGIRKRLVGFQANASSKNHVDLEGCTERQMDDIRDWTMRMAEFHRRFGLKVLGGCCGTGPEHLQKLVDAIGCLKKMNRVSGTGLFCGGSFGDRVG